ncbi:MAG: YHS domain-containing protein [Candidatus Latescibacterota bacterium]|jgi:YHS domain-containing protein|nr:MAG: YHS domain-containing protein [Candidatus Latescibacterota bacterium]
MKGLATFAALAAILITAAVVFAGETGEKKECSLCGYLVEESEALSARYEGAAYHFCSAGCKAYFDKDPKGVAAGMDYDPVCGMTVSKAKAVSAVHNGRRVHFCAEACKEKYFANPEEYEVNYDFVGGKVMRQKDMKYTSTFEGMPLYFETAENKAAFDKNPGAYVHEICPVTGKTFLRKDAGASMKHDGKTYYFCCESCMKKFKENPGKHLGKGREANYETCGEPKKTTTGCAAEKHGDESCQKIIESGGCPHMKAEAEKKAEKTEKTEKTKKTEKAKKRS